MPRALLCPYCGAVSSNVHKCNACGGRLDALSRQATQNSMGPWYLRDQHRPHHPGCSYDTLSKLIELGKVTPETVLRGPTTGQFWMLARRVPGIAHKLGICHSCQAPARHDDYACRSCGAVFQGERDRQHLGLGPIRPLPGQESPEMVAARLAVTMPEIPTPVPGARKPAIPPSVAKAIGHAPSPVNAERLRRLERRVVALRSRLIGSLSANIVLACAMVVAVTLLAIRQGGEPTSLIQPEPREPIYVGPSMGDSAEEETDPHSGPTDTQAAGATEQEPGAVADAPSGQPEAERPEPERELDITLMSWQDAETYLRAKVDVNDAQSLADGLEMLRAFDQAVGLPDAGRELRSAWEFRLEQLRLQGLP